MAIATTNPLVTGLRGMLGRSLVFRTLRGKTIVSQRPAAPKKQSDRQRENRSRFKQATMFAKIAMADPAKKAYYRAKAHKLKLPNAYTAAITDYMRKATITRVAAPAGHNSMVAFEVRKKDFDVTGVSVSAYNGPSLVQHGQAVKKSAVTWLYAIDSAVDVTTLRIHVTVAGRTPGTTQAWYS